MHPRAVELIRELRPPLVTFFNGLLNLSAEPAEVAAL